jgi:hypothetical protein
VNYVDASFVLAFAAVARLFAPDVWFLVRRLLGAEVRLGALAPAGHQPLSPAVPAPASLNEGGWR